jgi:hypothetical protein
MCSARSSSSVRRKSRCAMKYSGSALSKTTLTSSSASSRSTRPCRLAVTSGSKRLWAGCRRSRASTRLWVAGRSRESVERSFGRPFLSCVYWLHCAGVRGGPVEGVVGDLLPAGLAHRVVEWALSRRRLKDARPPCFLHSPIGATCPRLAVAGQERPDTRARQAFERGKRSLTVGRRSPCDDPGAPSVSVGVVRH